MFRLLFFLLPILIAAQTFESTTTAHIKNTYILEFIERTIEIGENKITIISQGKAIRDVQTLDIIRKEEKEFDKLGICTWYYCNSKNIPGTDKLIIVPKEKHSKQISIFEPSKNGASTKETKIILD